MDTDQVRPDPTDHAAPYPDPDFHADLEQMAELTAFLARARLDEGGALSLSGQVEVVKALEFMLERRAGWAAAIEALEAERDAATRDASMFAETIEELVAERLPDGHVRIDGQEYVVVYELDAEADMERAPVQHKDWIWNLVLVPVGERPVAGSDQEPTPVLACGDPERAWCSTTCPRYDTARLCDGSGSVDQGPTP